jgi:UDP:flavonoid glycosyltransferase YjiC (YdhE family)
VRLAGFPLFDGRIADALDPELLEFCQTGEPPIAFTLGTGMMHAAEFFRSAAEACRRIGRRGIFLTQFPQQLPDPLPGHVRHCRFAPFLQLFPHCAIVVHHGGIGTSAKALASGAPQLVLPLAFDQMDNAQRLRDLGAGDSLKPKRRTAPDLAAALSRLLDPAVRVRTQGLAELHAGEGDALKRAADWIEELAEKTNQVVGASKRDATSMP